MDLLIDTPCTSIMGRAVREMCGDHGGIIDKGNDARRETKNKYVGNNSSRWMRRRSMPHTKKRQTAMGGRTITDEHHGGRPQDQYHRGGRAKDLPPTPPQF